jgi:hypothetical protein
MRHDRTTKTALVALLLAALPLAAGAQPRPEPAPQSAPGNLNAAPPEKVAPPIGTRPDAREDSGDAGASTSGRLSRSNGTIVPPANVDPGMAARPPDTGPNSMTVLPPPGTGGTPK